MATTYQDYNWPSSSEVNITGIGSPTGSPVPADAVYIAGKNPEGNLTGVAVTDEGYVETMPAAGSVQHVIVDSSALPTGAATAANQATEISSLSAIQSNSATIATNTTGVSTAANQVTANSSLAAIQSSNATIATNTTGVSTAANQTTANSTLASILANQTNGTQEVQVTNFPGTQPISGTVTVTQSTGTNLHTVVDSSALPTGAATSANQVTTNSSLSTISGQLPTTLGQKASAASLAVVIASDQSSLPISTGGTPIANTPVYNSYSTTSITTSAYTQLVASTSNIINSIHIFDSSGQAMILAVGASGSEVVQLYIPPGGDTYSLNIPAGSRIAYKALTSNATSGYVLMSFLK